MRNRNYVRMKAHHAPAFGECHSCPDCNPRWVMLFELTQAFPKRTLTEVTTGVLRHLFLEPACDYSGSLSSPTVIVHPLVVLGRVIRIRTAAPVDYELS